MGCFLACFGTSKDAKIRRGNRHRHRILPRDQTSRCYYRPVEVSVVAPNQEKTETCYGPVQVSIVAPNQEKTELLIATPVSEIRDALPVEQTSSGKRKKVVTFDSIIKTYEPVTVYEVDDHEPERLENCEDEKKDLLAKLSKVVNSNSEDGSTTSSLGSTFPPNHRYQNCRESDDEIEDESDCDVYDLDEDFDNDDDDNDENLADEDDDGYEYRDAYYAHDDGRGRRLSDEFSSTESRSRDGNGYVHSVLNPVENLSQWKILKTKGIMTPQLKRMQKENSTPEAPKNPNQEMAVNASLSNWLPSLEPATKSKNNNIISFTNFYPEKGLNSPKCLEDRPILGALTVEEIKKFSTPSSSPRKSPNADDMPIIGSVGSYWSRDSDNDSGSVSVSVSVSSSYKGIPNTTSKYREDKRVNWHSTPFETRLDKALNSVDAKANSKA